MTAYDQVRYPGKFYPQSGIDRLAVMARLHGLQPAPPQACRALELGCGDGGNLIPQAAQFPDSHFLGLDLAASAVEAGRALIERLGLRNIELRVADIAGFSPPTAQVFDYVISHGVLSWVPEAVRARLLAICGAHLAPQGVAYISYSALPGGYLRNVPRDLMRFHTRQLADPQARARAGREAVALVQAAQPPGSFARQLLEREMAGSEGKDFFLLHDLLAEENEPLYFLDFMAAAGEVGLQFLAEAEPAALGLAAGLPPQVQQALADLPSRLEREQYLDFIQLRRFRQTLLCRQGPAPAPAFTPERLEGLFFSGGPVRDPRGVDLTALGALLPDFTQHVPALYSRDQLAIHTQCWDFCTEPGPRPRVSALNRELAAAGAPVVNATQGAFYLPSEALRRLVTLLDGTRTQDDLLDELAVLTPPRELEGLNPQALQRRLQLLAANAMLLA